MSTHFIISAAIVKESDLEEFNLKAEEVRKKHFGSSEMKSNNIKAKHDRRQRVLSDLLTLPFQIFAVCIDKKSCMDNMSIKGLNYKHSFYKFMNNIVHLEFRRAFKQITIIADQFGDSDYMQSFCRYVDRHQDQPNLFGDADFQFQDSRNALGIQVADIISGTLAYVFDTHKKGPDVPDYISLMSPKIIRIELYPKTFQNYVLENSPLADDYDKDIAELCFAQAVKFIEHNASEIDSDIRAQVIVLQYLLFRFMNNGTRGYIVTRELRDQLRNTELRSISDTAFRMRIIGRLRDKGVIIASSPQGYKIPSKRSELHDFINHDAKIVMPMLARLKKCRDLVKLATINQLDLLDQPEYASLKRFFDTYDT